MTSSEKTEYDKEKLKSDHEGKSVMWEEKKNKENESVRRKRIFAAILLYFCLLLFVANDAWVYQTPIVKITEVHTKESRKEEDVRGGREPYYTQNIKGILLNGEKKERQYG